VTRLLEAAGVSLVPRLAALDLACSSGEMIALVGANGSGKTSLLRALVRVPGAGGNVRIDSEEVDRAAEARRHHLLAFLPAMREVAWPISVRDIIALGLAGRDHGRVERMISDFALGDVRGREIGTLSTGERSRALLARAMVAKPRLLLLDEPLANLDPYWTLRTLELLRAAARGGAVVMIALHDLAQVDKFDRLLLLKDGRMLADGTPGQLRDQLGTLFGVESSPDGWRISRR
jgi:iron complex transport system ATP-binding protein